MKKTLGLGRGLDALIDTTHVTTSGSSSINEIPLSKIYANPDQPRHTFDEEALEELAQSIREHGVISPITLRKDSNDRYMIIASGVSVLPNWRDWMPYLPISAPPKTSRSWSGRSSRISSARTWMPSR